MPKILLLNTELYQLSKLSIMLFLTELPFLISRLGSLVTLESIRRGINPDNHLFGGDFFHCSARIVIK